MHEETRPSPACPEGCDARTIQPCIVRRIWVVLILLTGMMFAGKPLCARADPAPVASHQVVRLSDPSSDAIYPQIALGAHGKVCAVWQERQRPAQVTILRARDTFDQTSRVITVSSNPSLTPTDYDLIAGDDALVAWADPSAIPQVLCVRSLNSGRLSVRPIASEPYEVAFTLERSGRSHIAWATGDTVYYRAGGNPWIATTDIGSAGRVSDLSIARGQSGDVWVCWVVRSASGQNLGLYVWDPQEKAAERVVSQGTQPRVLVDGLGTAHLFWLSDSALYEATAPDWGQHARIATLESWDTAAVAPGPDAIHVVWVQDGTLWHASSLSWEDSRRPIMLLGSNVYGIDIAVDPINRVHVAWSAQDPSGVWGVFTCFAEYTLPQIGILYPAGGETLSGDTVVRAESTSFGTRLTQVEFWVEARASGSETEGDLYRLDVDQHGRDGWTAALRASALENGHQYRLVAIGTDEQGRTVRAVGDWFTVYHADGLRVWIERPTEDRVRGTGTIAVLAGGPRSPIERVDLSLSSPALDGLRADSSSSSVAVSTHVGDGSSAWPNTNWIRLSYDTRILPDGPLSAQVTAISTDGQVARATSTDAVWVDNAMAPAIRVTSPTNGQVVAEEIMASAEATDLDGRIERVEFYLEPSAAGSCAYPQPPNAVSPQAGFIWLGTDHDGSDGWRVRRPVIHAMDGSGWTVRAVAYDDQGLSNWARSEGQFTIVGYDHPALHITAPSPGRVLKGMRPVYAYVDAGEPAVVSLYALDRTACLTLLGDMQQEGERWTFAWDTTILPDGDYELLLFAQDPSGAAFSTCVRDLTVANDTPSLTITEPRPNSELQGSATVSLLASSESDDINVVRLYSRDAQGVLRPIGTDLSGADGWSFSWDTTRVLDGVYDLVAYGAGTHGGLAQSQQRIVVRNVSPAISLRPVETEEPLRGEVSIAWQVDHPLGLAVTVDVEYSPDGGAHWLPVAEALPSDETFVWDTTSYPDSREGLIRLTASDGQHFARTESGTFQIDNISEPPQVSLLAPAPSGTWSQQLHVTWEAQDPDRDPLTALLEYRRGTGPWKTIAVLDAGERSHLWPIADLVPADDYALRITVTDASGFSASDTVDGLSLTANAPPVVHLLAPKGDASMSSQAVVLWSTYDPDNDSLTIDLYCSDDAGQTWLPLAQDLPDTGYYAWQVSYLPAGTNYRLLIVASDGTDSSSDRSDELLVLGAPQHPQIEIASPLPGSTVTGQTLIRWWPNPLGAHLVPRTTISLRYPDGTWAELARDQPGSGAYLWDTRSLPDGAYTLRIAPQEEDDPARPGHAVTVYVQNDGNRPPHVELVCPRGGETWYGIREIVWRAEDPDGDPLTATLSYSPDAGTTWVTLDTMPAQQGRYVWDTRQAPPSNRLLLRIEVTDGEATALDKTPGAIRLSNDAWPPPLIGFLSPDDLGSLGRGDRVIWAAECCESRDVVVALELSQDGGLTWTQVERATGEAGQFVLPTLQYGLDYMLRLRATDGMHRVAVLSSPLKLFSLAQRAPDLEVDSPLVGEIRSGTLEITWSAQTPVNQEIAIDLALSSDGGETWHALEEGYPNTGVYNADTSEWPNGLYIVRITAHASDASAVDKTAPFYIQNPEGERPAVSLLTPHGGERWSGSKEIAWRIHNLPGGAWHASLYYSTDRGNSWQMLAENLPSEDGYIWDTITAPNCDEMWLKVEVMKGSFVIADVSDSPIAIANLDAPTVTLSTPDSPVWTGIQRLAWQARISGSSDGIAGVAIHVSLDGGQTWETLLDDLPPEGQTDWDTSDIPEDSIVLLRAVATSDNTAGVDLLAAPVTVRGNPPAGSTIAPSDAE